MYIKKDPQTWGRKHATLNVTHETSLHKKRSPNMGTKTDLGLFNPKLKMFFHKKRSPNMGTKTSPLWWGTFHPPPQLKKDPQTWGRKQKPTHFVIVQSVYAIKKRSPNMGTKTFLHLIAFVNNIEVLKKDPQTWGRKQSNIFAKLTISRHIKKDPQTWGRKRG